MKNFKEDVFTFGKYKGEHLDEIDDKEYLEWVLEELEVVDDITEEFVKNIEVRLMDI